MVEIIADTSLQSLTVPGRAHFPGHSLTFIVKGTFDLRQDANATLANDQDFLSGELRHGDGASLCYPDDFALFKPNAEILLKATAHAPHGEAVSGLRVGAALGDWRKELAVFGDRTWDRAGVGGTASPAPFVSMPLTYENAFGGSDHGLNVYGKGFDKQARALPNIEYPDHLVSHKDDAPPPAGFCPLDIMHPDRARHLGKRYDAAWERTRWPWFAEDFDWRFFSAAPQDQQIAGYLRGDEPLVFHNLHADLPEFRSALPGLRPRLFLARGEAFDEAALHLDTVWAEPDAERLVLIWRAVVAVADARGDEIDVAFLTHEALGAGEPAEVYRARCRALRVAEDEEVETLEGDMPAREESPAAAQASHPKPAPTAAAVTAAEDALLEKTMVDLVMQMERLGAAPALIDAVRSGADDAILSALKQTYGEDPEAFRAMLRESHDGINAALVKMGEEPVPFDEPERAPDSSEEAHAEETAPSRLTREDVAAYAAAARPLSELDLSGLDLSGLDLSGADLSNANLKQAVLDGAVLEEAMCDGAVLHGASLKNAKCRNAVFSDCAAEGADFSGADLTDADFNAADLRKARFQNAICDGAVFDHAQGDEASFAEASCAGASFTEAHLAAAVFRDVAAPGAAYRGACLDGAVFDGAHLEDAGFEDAHGRDVSADRARMPGARLSRAAFPGGRFSYVKAEGAIWVGAQLEAASFFEADMARANFSEAVLTNAVFQSADCRWAQFIDADLTGARAAYLNGFEGAFLRARLSNADMRGGNYYGADFCDAVTEGAAFDTANLASTILIKRGAAA